LQTALDQSNQKSQVLFWPEKGFQFDLMTLPGQIQRHAFATFPSWTQKSIPSSSGCCIEYQIVCPISGALNNFLLLVFGQVFWEKENSFVFYLDIKIQ